MVLQGGWDCMCQDTSQREKKGTRNEEGEEGLLENMRIALQESQGQRQVSSKTCVGKGYD